MIRNIVLVLGVSSLIAISSGPALLQAQRGGRAPAAPPPAAGAPPLAAGAQDVPPTPRWPDGHVNLGATAGAKGYWEARPGLGTFPRAADIPLQPWARALYQYRTAKTDLYPPQINCKPGGGPSFFLAPGFEFIEIPELKSIFQLNIAGPHSWRVIYMDGRPHPTGDALRPTFFGHSTGKWDGDTLVIDTVGFNEKQWITGSYPTTEQLHLTEKITRPNLKSLNYEATIDDPGAYTAPWTIRWSITERSASKWNDVGEMFEYICQDERQ